MVVAVGISIQLTIPASVSKELGPTLSELMEVMPEDESYSRAPESTENPPLIEVVAFLPEVVSKVRSGTAVLEVAKENA